MSILGQLAQMSRNKSGNLVALPYRAISVAFRYCPTRSHFEQASRTMTAGYSARLSDPSGMTGGAYRWRAAPAINSLAPPSAAGLFFIDPGRIIAQHAHLGAVGTDVAQQVRQPCGPAISGDQCALPVLPNTITFFEQASRTMTAGYATRLSDPLGMTG